MPRTLSTTMSTIVSTRASADLRWLRAGLVGLVAAGLGGLAHLAAGGLLPSVPEVVALVVLLVALSAAALGSPAGYGRLVLLVGGGQALMHLALTATAGHGSSSGHPHAPGGTTQPDHGTTYGSHGSHVDGDAGLTHVVDHLGSELVGANLAMTLAHLAAAAGVAAWLLAGEQALWALVALLGAHVTGRLLAAVRHLGRLGLGAEPAGRRTTPPRAVHDRCPSRARAVAANGPTGRRGPPALLLLTSPTT